jgi:hypothetical protein
VPLTEACEISTFAVPVLVKVTVCDCCCPTVTLPKLSLVGLSVSCPEEPDPELPFNGTSTRLSDALLLSASVALKVPEAVGANFTLRFALCPAASVMGKADVREKALVEMVPAETMTEAEPELVALMVKVLLLPLATLPKLSDGDPMESVPAGGGVVDEPALTPAHPVHSAMHERRRKTTMTDSRRLVSIRLGARSDISWIIDHVSIAINFVTHGAMSFGSMAVVAEGELSQSVSWQMAGAHRYPRYTAKAVGRPMQLAGDEGENLALSNITLGLA